MSTCGLGNGYDGHLGVRISSIFVILVGSLFGAWFPVYASRHKNVAIPSWMFFITKYFGSGVIVATAFIHLLAPANEALTDPCLSGPITEYAWVEGICLMSIFVLFFVELMMMRYGKFGASDGHGAHPEPSAHNHGASGSKDHERPKSHDQDSGLDLPSLSRPVPGASSPDNAVEEQPLSAAEPYSAQLTGVFILEFGVVFHSVFIGLTLAVAGKEFDTLYAVLAFHQTFEGLALGGRLASIDWPKTKRITPYFLAAGYAISTPLAIVIGLGVRTSYHPGSQASLIANGIFDSISAGILIYTGLIELMAHDFLFSTHMQCAPVREMLCAFGTMCCGAFLMALLGKWA